jgi:hypothetical protein
MYWRERDKGMKGIKEKKRKEKKRKEKKRKEKKSEDEEGSYDTLCLITNNIFTLVTDQ